MTTIIITQLRSDILTAITASLSPQNTTIKVYIFDEMMTILTSYEFLCDISYNRLGSLTSEQAAVVLFSLI